MKQDGNYALSFAGKYTLPVCDVQTERRNFDGYVEYENMLPLDDDGGTTDTDVKTHGVYGSEGYSRIYGGDGLAPYTNRNKRKA